MSTDFYAVLVATESCVSVCGWTTNIICRGSSWELFKGRILKKCYMYIICQLVWKRERTFSKGILWSSQLVVSPQPLPYACTVSDCHGFTILPSPSVMPSSAFHHLLQLERTVRTNPAKNKKQWHIFTEGLVLYGIVSFLRESKNLKLHVEFYCQCLHYLFCSCL